VGDAGERDHEKRQQSHEEQPGGAGGGCRRVGFPDQLGNGFFSAVDDVLARK
jgi:hypothetical protein